VRVLDECLIVGMGERRLRLAEQVVCRPTERPGARDRHEPVAAIDRHDCVQIRCALGDDSV
jgi:hypothetical protein